MHIYNIHIYICLCIHVEIVIYATLFGDSVYKNP